MLGPEPLVALKWKEIDTLKSNKLVLFNVKLPTLMNFGHEELLKMLEMVALTGGELNL